MSDEELVCLIKADINVRENMTQLFTQRKGYIRYFAKRYIGIAEIEDLMQEGYIGLVNAVETYDNIKYPRFTDHLKFHLIRVFNSFLLQNNLKGKISRWDNDHIRSYLKVKNFFLTNMDREPTIYEYIAYLRTSAEIVDKIRYITDQRNVLSMDKQIDDNMDGDTYGNGLLSDGECLEDEVINRMINDDLSVGLWDIVRWNTTEEEYRVLFSYFKFSIPLEKFANETGISRKEASNRFYRAIGKLKSYRVKNVIIERFGIETVQYTRGDFKLYSNRTDEIAIHNIENEIKYISYILTSTVDGFKILKPYQIQMAYDNKLINDKNEITVEWQKVNPGIKPKEIEQYDLCGAFIKRWKSASDAAKKLQIDESLIRKCVKGKKKTAGRYVWKEVA